MYLGREGKCLPYRESPCQKLKPEDEGVREEKREREKKTETRRLRDRDRETEKKALAKGESIIAVTSGSRDRF